MKKENCIFCKIAKGEIPCYKIYEDDSFLVFLEISPIRPGHTLLITKEHYDDIYAIPNNLFTKLMDTYREIAPIVKLSAESDKVGMAIAGLDLNHAHLHILPLDTTSDLNFENQKLASEDELIGMQKKISDLKNNIHRT